METMCTEIMSIGRWNDIEKSIWRTYWYFVNFESGIHVETSASNRCHNFHVDSRLKIDVISTNFSHGISTSSRWQIDEDVSIGTLDMLEKNLVTVQRRIREPWHIKGLFSIVVNIKLKGIHSGFKPLISDVGKFLGPSLKLSNHNCWNVTQNYYQIWLSAIWKFQAIRVCLRLIEQNVIYDCRPDKKWSLKKIS